VTKHEFLDQLGLSSEEFRDLLQKFSSFLGTLNEAQRDAVRRSNPSIAEAARTFGPEVTPAELEKILEGMLDGVEFVLFGCFSGRLVNPNLGRSIAPHQPKPEKPK